MGKSLQTSYQRAAIFQNAVKDMSTIGKNTIVVPHWIDGSDCFWYRRQIEGGAEFRMVNASRKSNEEAFDHQAMATALTELTGCTVSAHNLPISQVEITLSPLKVLFSAFEQKFCFDAETKQCVLAKPRLDRGSLERLVSPDGKKIAFSRDYNLWIRDVKTGEERALTSDGEKDYTYATPPVSWGFPTTAALQACWSPDSRTLFSVQTDTRQVKRTPIINYVPQDGSVRPIGMEYPCGYLSDQYVEECRIFAVDSSTGIQCNANYRRIPISRSGFGLFSDNLGWWSNDGRHAYFVDMERGDKVARVVEFNIRTGATKILFEETSDTFLNLSPSEVTAATLLPLSESDELVWFSERNGWAHLYLYDLKNGELKHPITQGDWMVREILSFDSERRELFFQAGGRIPHRDPYYLDICRVDIDTGEITALTESDHEYSVFGSVGLRTTISLMGALLGPEDALNASGVSPDGSFVVATRSRADEVPVTVLLDRDGVLVLVLEKADIDEQLSEWPWPEPVKLVADDGETPIYGAVFRPSDFDSEKKYPIIDVSVTSGEFSSVPKGSFSNAPLAGCWYLQAAALAELGFIVVTIDGRGTPYRDRSFVDECYGRMLSYNNTDDRIAGIKQLAKQYPYMDLGRVGVIGFNGFGSAVYGLLERPDFYKVGVSHALQDVRTEATPVGERYEDLSTAKHKRHYADQLVENLSGKLLLMHGTADRMDHPAATWRLIDALQKANKDFDMLMLPCEAPHKSGEHIGTGYAFRRTWDYFVMHLAGVAPPQRV